MTPIDDKYYCLIELVEALEELVRNEAEIDDDEYIARRDEIVASLVELITDD